MGSHCTRGIHECMCAPSLSHSPPPPFCGGYRGMEDQKSCCHTAPHPLVSAHVVCERPALSLPSPTNDRSTTSSLSLPLPLALPSFDASTFIYLPALVQKLKRFDATASTKRVSGSTQHTGSLSDITHTLPLSPCPRHTQHTHEAAAQKGKRRADTIYRYGFPGLRKPCHGLPSP